MHALLMPRGGLLVEIFYEGVGLDYQMIGDIAGHRHFAWERTKGFVGRHDLEACDVSYYLSACRDNRGVVEHIDIEGRVHLMSEASLREIWPPAGQE